MKGVSVSAPRNHRYYQYRQTVPMGRTMMTRKEVEQALMAMQSEWSGSDYDFLSKNCGSFCDDLCVRLGVGHLPRWITCIAETLTKMPAIRSLADYVSRVSLTDSISGYEGSPQAAAGGNAFLGFIGELEEEHVSAEVLGMHPVTPSGGLHLPPTMCPSASPVNCRFRHSPSPICRKPLPRERSEAFRVDHDHSATASMSSLVARTASMDMATGKYEFSGGKSSSELPSAPRPRRRSVGGC